MKGKRLLFINIYRTGTPVSQFQRNLLGRAFTFVGIGLVITLNHMYLSSSGIVDFIGIVAVIILAFRIIAVRVTTMNAEEGFDFLAKYLFEDRMDFLKKMHPEMMKNLQEEFEKYGQKNQDFDDKKPGNC